MTKKNISNLSVEELEKEIIALNEPKYRAEQIFASLHKNYINEIKNIPGIPFSLKSKLEDFFLYLH